MNNKTVEATSRYQPNQSIPGIWEFKFFTSTSFPKIILDILRISFSHLLKHMYKLIAEKGQDPRKTGGLKMILNTGIQVGAKKKYQFQREAVFITYM